MLISFGHSCQSRFIIDGIDPAGRRMPFDFNITTRRALIAALATDGASLRHDEGDTSVFREPREAREGIHAGGMYFWHDYPLAEDKLRLADGWQREIGRVNEKYAALWSRLAAILRSDERKTLVLSNSQHNLVQFAQGDAAFASDFGLGRHAFEQLATALECHGARNYRLLFLTRSVAELAETAAIDDPRFDHRFVGILSLRPDRRVAASIARSRGSTGIAALCGSYEQGEWEISAHSMDVAIIHRRSGDNLHPHGSITLADDGHVAWLEGRDRFSDIVHGDGEIRFTDGNRWHRD
jgi:hypothetical protein